MIFLKTLKLDTLISLLPSTGMALVITPDHLTCQTMLWTLTTLSIPRQMKMSFINTKSNLLIFDQNNMCGGVGSNKNGGHVWCPHEHR